MAYFQGQAVSFRECILFVDFCSDRSFTQKHSPPGHSNYQWVSPFPCQDASFFNKYYAYLGTRWFKVTFFHPLVGGHLPIENGHLTIPKRSQRSARYMFYMFHSRWCAWLLSVAFMRWVEHSSKMDTQNHALEKVTPQSYGILVDINLKFQSYVYIHFYCIYLIIFIYYIVLIHLWFWGRSN